MKRFLELIKPLKDTGKLACILIQLPPGMKFGKDRIEEFIRILPADLHFALEYRNETWLTDEAHNLLSDYDVATVIVDGPLLSPEFRLTSDIAYVRWHGRGEKMWYNYRYSKDELAAWMPKLKEMSQNTDVYGYFNNHYHGYAPENCIDMLDMLGVATSQQKEARHEIIESGSDRIIADVKGYSVYIDLEKRFILHDCPDWKRTIRERRLCKHIGALVLALPEDRARMVLENIKRQQWEFSQYTGRGETY